jgi:hypothetical protein
VALGSDRSKPRAVRSSTRRNNHRERDFRRDRSHTSQVATRSAPDDGLVAIYAFLTAGRSIAPDVFGPVWHYQGAEIVDQYVTEDAIWELTYFGHARV